MPHRFVFVWENLGPTHEDRLAAMERRFPGEVAAIQFWPTSIAYEWTSGSHRVPTRTLLPASVRSPGFRIGWHLFRACRRLGAHEVYLCHYQLGAVFLAALLLRLTGARVICMIDSKFDDYPRALWRDVAKVVLLLPYNGAFVSAARSALYMRYLGFALHRIAEGYDTLSVDRIREQAPGPPAPDGPAHAERDFVIVARLVAKKNIALALAAFAQFRAETGSTRTLRILGSGDCEPSLRALADELDVADATVFEGFVQTARVSEALSRALCLILPSSEEQFGLVVIEAMAMGVPALVSSNAGAVEKMIDNGVNGWIIDPSSPRALVAAMALLNCDAAAWMRMATAAREDSIRGDVPSFVEGVMALSEPGRG